MSSANMPTASIPAACSPSALDGQSHSATDAQPPPIPVGRPPSAPDAREPAEARCTEAAFTFSDAAMVFGATHAPGATQVSAPATATRFSRRRSSKPKLNTRKCTPAPPTKGNGRKRLDLSPIPEDKQIRKKIDFEKGLGPNFNPTTIAEAEEQLPDSGVVAGDGGATGQKGEDNLNVPWSKNLDSSKTKEALGGERSNLPEMVHETKMHCESGLVASIPGESHGALAVPAIMETKKDDLLLLANLETADELDTMVAQPLLGGGSPVVTQRTGGACNTPFPAAATTTSSPPYIASAAAQSRNGLAGTNSHGGAGKEIKTRMLETGSPRRLEMENPWSSDTPPTNFGSTHIPCYVEFPPLEKGRTLKIRDVFETGSNRIGKETRGPKPTSVEGVASSGGPVPVTPSAGLATAAAHTTSTKHTASEGPVVSAEHGASAGHETTAETSTGKGGVANGPKTMAERIRERPDPNGPQVFVPEKIANIGFASTSNGLPSIYFSGAEIKKLADNIGHAIVGKFSHSIPNANQIQKALDNIKFSRGFSWKYINAKHILVQFEDITDYARMLGGPKGTPVWYIDRHPMRVFKWTPDFDAYCESPIAAIWCNLIGLPIHLFDQSALFAIGKLLGTPIQVDRATADKSRLSFARICVEIDITKPPPEEIILDICGREIVQQIRWPKIPAYCHECKHVGHSSEACYAAGRMARPEKRNYNTAPPKQRQDNNQGAKGNQVQNYQQPKENDNGRYGKNKDKGPAYGGASLGGPSSGGPKASAAEAGGWIGPDILGGTKVAPHGAHREGRGRREDEDLETTSEVSVLDGPHGFRDSGSLPLERGFIRGGRGSAPRGRGGMRGTGRFSPNGGRGQGEDLNFLSTNQFYTLMENGEFDAGDDGEDESSGMEVQPSPGDLTSHPHGGTDGQIIIFEGGGASSPGMI